MKIKYLLLTSAIVLSSCNSTEEAFKAQVVGSWKAKESKTNHLVAQKEIQSNLSNDFESSDLTLYFYPDSSYTKISNKTISHGKWSYTGEDEIKFGNSRLKVDELEENNVNAKSVANILDEKDSNISKLFFDSSSFLEDYTKEPFHVNNNFWRHKPIERESDEEVRDRLLNYIQHVAYILHASYEKNTSTVSFANSKGIIKIFQGGVGIVNKDKIHESWINGFYNKENAMKAYNLYNSCLDRNGVRRTKSTGDWVKDDYKLLMRLHSKIKNIDIDQFESLAKQNAKDVIVTLDN